MEHPAVELAWCAAVGDGGSGDDTTSRLEAAVRLSSDSQLSRDDSSATARARVSSNSLRAFMAERLPAHMVPVAFHNLDPAAAQAIAELHVGQSPHGKRPSQVHLAALMSGLPDLSETTAGDVDAALPAREALVAASWAKALKLPVTSFAVTDSFFDFGGSLKFFQLAKALNVDFGSELTVAALLAAPTLASMTALVFSDTDTIIDIPDSKVFNAEAEAANFPIVLQLKGGPVFPAAVSEAICQMTLDSYCAMPLKSVLVTGCTGYVGAFLMESLARREDVVAVVALVRAKDTAIAAERLRDTCHKFAIDESPGFESWFTKVRPACGDVAQVRFGLSEAQYAALALSVHAVVHGAAEVNMLKPVEALSAVNIGGTSNVLALCALARLPMLFASTVLPLEGAKPTGYRQSKEAAEALCLKARADYGVPSVVLQLGDIGFASVDVLHSAYARAIPEEDAIVILLSACIKVGRIPHNPAWSVSIMPVNHCTDMLARFMLDAPADLMTSKARELSGGLVPWDTLCEWIAPSLPNVVPCDLDDWKAEVAKVAELGEASALANAYPPGAFATAKRALMLLPSMEHEFAAGDRRRRDAKGTNSELVVDAVWGARFGVALALLEAVQWRRDL